MIFNRHFSLFLNTFQHYQIQHSAGETLFWKSLFSNWALLKKQLLTWFFYNWFTNSNKEKTKNWKKTKKKVYFGKTGYANGKISDYMVIFSQNLSSKMKNITKNSWEWHQKTWTGYGCLSQPILQNMIQKYGILSKQILTLFRMGFLGAAHGWWGQKGPPP